MTDQHNKNLQYKIEKKKNMLIVAYFYPPVSGTGIPAIQRVNRFTRYIKIFEPYILTIKPENYPSYLKIEKNLTPIINNEKICRSGSIDLMKILSYFKNSFLRKNQNSREAEIKIENNSNEKNIFINLASLKEFISILLCYPDFARPWLFHAIWEGIKAIRKWNVEIILATGMPWTSLIIGLILKMIFDVKLVVDFRDPWVDNPYIEKQPFESRLDKICESTIIRKANIILSNTQQLYKNMSCRYPEHKSKIMLLPNGYDPEDFVNLPNRDINDERIVVAHAGTLYLKRNPIPLFKAISKLKRYHPNSFEKIAFHQIGSVSLDKDFDELANEYNIEKNVKRIEFLPHKECLAYLAACDVLLIIQPGTLTQIPSKFYEYLFLKKPILSITEPGGALWKMVKSEGFGKVYSTDDIDGIVEYFYRFVERKETKFRMLKNGYPNIEKYDASKLCGILEKKIFSLL